MFGLALCTSLAILLLVYVLLALVSLAVSGELETVSRYWDAGLRANLVFLLRIGPAAGALFFLAFIAWPSFLAFEPRDTHEAVTRKLCLLAALATGGTVWSIYRALQAWRGSKKLTSEWIARSRRITLKGVSIPAYALDHQFPVVAVVGIYRPCLFVATQLLDSLPPEQLAAVVAHEMGHLAARDNLRRLLLLLCPDARALLRMNPDAPWMDAAETAADSFAIRHEQRVPVDLAAALINVARAIPEGATIANTPLIQLLIPNSKSGVAERVLRLLSVSPDDPSKRSGEWSNGAKALLACLPLTAALLAFWTSPTCLRATHSLLENIVRILS